MAYNNGLPIGYVPPFSGISPYAAPQQAMQPAMQMQSQMMMQQSQEQSGPIWVQGEAGAKSFLVAPGKTVPLWDSEAQVIYMKTADQSGMPSMKILDYTIREGNNLPPKAQDAPEYATKDEVSTINKNLKHEIDVIKESLGIE